jgi:hypothetical protein
MSGVPAKHCFAQRIQVDIETKMLQASAVANRA